MPVLALDSREKLPLSMLALDSREKPPLSMLALDSKVEADLILANVNWRQSYSAKFDEKMT